MPQTSQYFQIAIWIKLRITVYENIVYETIVYSCFFFVLLLDFQYYQANEILSYYRILFSVTYKRKTFWFSNSLAQIDYQSRTHSLHLAHIAKNLQLFDSLAFLTDLVEFGSVTQLCSTLCNPMDCSTPGLPVHHQLLELAQAHVH